MGDTSNARALPKAEWRRSVKDSDLGFTGGSDEWP